MRTEVQCGCEFISGLLTQRHLPVQFARPFRRRMEELLLERYRDHWDPSNPNRGSAYRCIRINGLRLDPVVKEAAKVTGLTNISEYLPSQLTLWIDPSDVSYRFGEDGSICSCTLDTSACGGVSRSSTYGGAAPPSLWSPSGMAANTANRGTSPVSFRGVSPPSSTVRRSSSTPTKRRPLTPPTVARSISPSSSSPSSSPPSSSKSPYYMNQMYDSLSGPDYAISVRV